MPRDTRLALPGTSDGNFLIGVASHCTGSAGRPQCTALPLARPELFLSSSSPGPATPTKPHPPHLSYKPSFSASFYLHFTTQILTPPALYLTREGCSIHPRWNFRQAFRQRPAQWSNVTPYTPPYHYSYERLLWVPVLVGIRHGGRMHACGAQTTPTLRACFPSPRYTRQPVLPDIWWITSVLPPIRS